MMPICRLKMYCDDIAMKYCGTFVQLTLRHPESLIERKV
jgi:hypothetical protein